MRPGGALAPSPAGGGAAFKLCCVSAPRAGGPQLENSRIMMALFFLPGLRAAFEWARAARPRALRYSASAQARRAGLCAETPIARLATVTQAYKLRTPHSEHNRPLRVTAGGVLLSAGGRGERRRGASSVSSSRRGHGGSPACRRSKLRSCGVFVLLGTPSRWPKRAYGLMV